MAVKEFEAPFVAGEATKAFVLTVGPEVVARISLISHAVDNMRWMKSRELRGGAWNDNKHLLQLAPDRFSKVTIYGDFEQGCQTRYNGPVIIGQDFVDGRLADGGLPIMRRPLP